MNPTAKSVLSKTIKNLRARLIEDFAHALEARYRLSRSVRDAGLDEGRLAERERIDEWVGAQERGEEWKKEKQRRGREEFIAEIVREAAYTLINRLVLLRLMEEAELVKPAVLTGGWQSSGYREWCDWAPALLDDETDGYATLLRLLFDELAVELPGVFGDVGLTGLVPLPPQTLRAAVEALNDEALKPCWSDDTTLGWVYQYFNDPDREALDAKINSRGKVEPHEVASKTQLFTERYMVEWLLQNSLGPIWFEVCARNGWTPEVVDHGVLDELEARRADWRKMREAGEVALDELMPIRSEVEERWKYYVRPADGEGAARDEGGLTTLRDLKLLDPACGSGHFLVIAFDLLLALYKEEARHRNESWSDGEITRWIIEDNLHGIDIDPRAVQIAAAALYLKGRMTVGDFRPERLNLVAPDLTIGNLPDDDPALVELRRAVEEETGIPAELVDKLVHSLKETHHLGTLLKVDDEIDAALRELEGKAQGDLFGPAAAANAGSLEEPSDARQALVDLLEDFLAAHSSSEDLGLRLRGEQLANGIRFVRLNREGRYDLVVANPPYLGSSNMRSKKYIKKHYPRGKADLYACILERGLQFVRDGGMSAMITIRGWMFIKTYEDIRKHLLTDNLVTAIADLHFGAFNEMKDVSVTMSVVKRQESGDLESKVVRPVEYEEVVRDLAQPRRNQSGLVAPYRVYEFSAQALEGIEGQPLVYWWEPQFLHNYLSTPKISDVAQARTGLQTGNNVRFLRNVWEVQNSAVFEMKVTGPTEVGNHVETPWSPYIKGASGAAWYESLSDVVRWSPNALEIRLHPSSRPQNREFYFKSGVAFSTIGAAFRV